MAQLTPMMQQYLQVKQQHPDCILFFRLGDFYEMFQDDARTASKELDLTLTTRDRNKEEQTPMCGVPYHSAESYIARLVAKGYKVAICEQMEDPALAKGLVRRDITRIVTPGTVTESSMLDESRNNYFACVFAENGAWGLSFCDVSTGAFFVTSAEGEAALARVISELGRFSPAQVLRGGEAAANETLSDTLRDKLACCADIGDDSLFAQELTAQTLEAQFGKTPEALGLSDTAGRSAGALLYTLHELQKSPLSHIQMPEYYLSGRFMELDMTAVRNLELTQTLRGGEKRGSLLWTLDKTKTALGSRLLRSWLEKPSLNPKQIKQRLDAVEELTKNTIEREELIHMLEDATDLERVMARIVTGSANARDLLALRNGCLILPHLRAALPRLDAPLFAALYEELDGLEDISDLLRTAIVDEPPFTVREGGMIREGYHEELDFLRDILHGGKGTLAEIELAEKEKTGIRTLRVGYNRVFGYYIEVSKGQSALVPEHYIRKQTLANGERYITEELKTLESTILGAKERANTLEYELFSALREKLSEQAGRVQRSARAVASLDVLSCFASIAVSRNYCKPEVDLSGEISIRDGRHPVVEQVLKDSLFVPNDTALDTANNRVAIITGPNMAGKSTYMRQVALIVLMAQIGSFVPAKDARIGIVDRIFTRIGASDDLSSGQSTFMVEMTEVADILSHATARSLLLLDEIGRGTSTFDGMAIARAVLEFAADSKRLGAKTLFATHYHELTDIERELAGVRNYNIAVKKRKDDIVFLRKIVPGAADDSYGVEVAKLAGLPERVVSRARTLLKDLENGAPLRTVTLAADDQISLTAMENDALRRRLDALRLETLTPIEALNALYELKKML